MKREKLVYPVVKPIRPLFWKECRFCKKEFRRELGYEIEDYTLVNAHLYWSYCCNECAEDIEEVKALIYANKYNLKLLRKQN